MNTPETRRRVRLQKVIAASGVASRREAEVWIAAGQVSVNGRKVTELGYKVDPETDRIQVDGRPLRPTSRKHYYLFHKPRNVLVARRDPRGRPLIYDYLTKLPTLLHPAGRLDFDSEGLLLLTNDGPLLRALTHPSSQVPKAYHVKVRGPVGRPALARLKAGVSLEDGLAQAVVARRLKQNPNNSWLEIVMTEGRRREVRRMCEAIGHPVLRLKRVAIGPLKLGTLRPGHYRPLTDRERIALVSRPRSH